MQKLYCYVDETGQDTQGDLFLVALVIVEKEREHVRKILRQIEERSGKTSRKWTHTTRKQKEAYLKEILGMNVFQGKIFYQQFSHTTKYLSCIVEAIVRGIIRTAPREYRAVILIDGLGRHERRIVGRGLRVRHIRTEKIRGLRDESDEFIRVADAVAGFIRDALEGQAYAKAVYAKALQEKLIEPLSNENPRDPCGLGGTT